MNKKTDLFNQAAAAALSYIAAERDGQVNPGDSNAISDVLAEYDLERPVPAGEVISLLARLGRDHATRSTGGRYFGFVTGGTDPTALAASVLATAWDQNAALPAMSPLAAALDGRVTEQVVELLGLPAKATASFCGGASVANLTAIITARDALLAAVGWDVGRDGLNGAPLIRVIISDEAHVSVDKGLRLAGIGTSSITRAPVDERGRIDPEAFPDLDRGPTLIVCQAGNVNTGHSDPFEEIIGRIPHNRRISTPTEDGIVKPVSGQDAPIWVHVDGAFGLWAAAAEEYRHQVAGVELADSWATDCHKWLNVPYDNGVVVVAERQHLNRSMAASAAYLHGIDNDRAPMHLGLQMSQAARAVPVWAALASMGRQGVADLVADSCQLAQRMASRMVEGGAAVLAPVALNQVLVHFDDDVTTQNVIAIVGSEGTCWMGGTTWQGRQAMRISVSDRATTESDIDEAASAVLAAWFSVRSETGPPD